MKKSWLNFWLGAAMFADGLLLALTGLIMKYVLPPGQGYRRGQGLSEDSFFWLGRHQWGSIHFDFALILIALLLVHLILHWNWIVGRIKELRKLPAEVSDCKTGRD